jgi:molecular chaperone GrpE (heat shock protein)
MMEDRIAKLESGFLYLEKEVKEFKTMHKEEIAELKEAFKTLNSTLQNIREDIESFRQTHIQIKYFIIGGALIWIAKEVGITHFLKLLLGIL